MVFQDPFSSLNPVHTVRHHLERPLRLHQPNLKGTERQAACSRTARAREARSGADPAEIPARAVRRPAPADQHRAGPGGEPRGDHRRRADLDARRLGAARHPEPPQRHEAAARSSRVLYITHDIATARYVAEEIMVMYAGQIVEWGETESVLVQPAAPLYPAAAVGRARPGSSLRRGAVQRRTRPHRADPEAVGDRAGRRCARSRPTTSSGRCRPRAGGTLWARRRRWRWCARSPRPAARWSPPCGRRWHG